MGLFDTLKSAVFGESSEKVAPSEVPSQSGGGHLNVDVAVELDAKAKAHPEKLDWQKSIVDLMKLVDMDSSYSNRKTMAIELGYSEEDIESKGSAEMNMWLHKQVLAQLAEDSIGDTDAWAGPGSFPDTDNIA